MLTIGKVVNTHGVRGEIKVYSYSGELENFKHYKHITLKRGVEEQQYEIMGVKIQKNTAILRLLGVFDMDSAKKLRDYEVLVESSHVPPLPEDAFYIVDLMGCSVFQDKQLLGVLKDVVFTGSNDVYIVEREGKADLLIPALKSVVINVDTKNREIEVKLPDGLLEIYE